ncbi:MAG: hypothetical protein GY943_24320 [Chloroflexi bacterium]|nr:hypothetical protein [Chloroflexota bacterium]
MNTKTALNLTQTPSGVYELSDKEREAQIDEMFHSMKCASTREARLWAAEEMRVLIAGRSVKQIEKMEREKGFVW